MPQSSVLKMVTPAIVTAVMVAVTESARVPLRLTVASPKGTNTTVTFTADDEAMREMGLTKEMMESSLVHADAKGRVSQEVSESRVGSSLTSSACSPLLDLNAYRQ